MVPETKKFELEIGGKTVTVETGKYAQSTNGSVTVRCGDTMLFVHCCVSKEPRVGIDFFPLLIDYEERMSAIGRIPGGYNRSEGKASDKAILISRLIDRPIRPLFPKGYRNDIQIVAQLFSYDQQNQPDTLAMLGASCALMLSGAPFEGPIGAVRVSRDENGNMIANPTHQQADKSDLDIVVAGTHDSVIMVEAGCKFVTEDDIMNAVEFAQGEIRKQCEAQEAFAKECGVEKEVFVNPYDTSEIKKIIDEIIENKNIILFIDEIGELDDTLQNELLKVLEDKRAYFDSAYFEPNDPNVPEYIKKLFTEGAPADFVLIGATTRDSYYLNPALRSRCAEIYFEPLTPKHIETIVLNAAHKLNAKLDDEVAQIISEYTIEGRKAINILADAYSNALVRQENDMDNILITKEDIYTVAQVSRLTPFITKKASDTSEIGKIFGLGVAGFIGSVIEIEAIAFKAHEKGKGILRFNQTAGSMAQDSVFNAAAVVRKLTNEDIHDYDIHINIIGGGNIDGPSAGTAILIALISAITQKPIRQDIAITGEISIQGLVRPVGGVFEKAYGASQAGIKTLIIPEENAKDIPPDLHGLKVHPVKTAQEALAFAFDKI